MLIKAEQRFLRMSPRKLREVVGSIRGIKSPARAIEYLEAMQKSAALPLAKVVKQAVANAKNNMKVSEDTLRLKSLEINDGPAYKRWQPVSRGQAHPIKKYTSHIRVVLESEPQEKKVAKVPPARPAGGQVSQVSKARKGKEGAQG
ncbi:MAG: 50S ribosomal protein L22 [Candidatus Blackburnbacteria bacterium]|nr:50S ribosomal protein L22 [Candidatus Blackburnbacteria bacterium]